MVSVCAWGHLCMYMGAYVPNHVCHLWVFLRGGGGLSQFGQQGKRFCCSFFRLSLPMMIFTCFWVLPNVLDLFLSTAIGELPGMKPEDASGQAVHMEWSQRFSLGRRQSLVWCMHLGGSGSGVMEMSV